MSTYACDVQRLYSMFPAGAPGVALLILRGCLAAALASIISPTGWEHTAFFALLIMLCVGLFTPIVCALAAIAVLLNLSHLLDSNPVELVIVPLSAISYAFLGPGAYSIDSLLFGRRMLVSTDSDPSKRDD